MYLIYVYNEIKKAFESANYLKVIELSKIHQKLAHPYKIGALVFLGEARAAKNEFEKIKGDLGSECLIEAKFFLFLGSLRSQDYPLIFHDLLEIFNSTNTHKKQRTRFFLYQAIGLLRYYRGEFQKVEQNTLTALDLAFRIDDPYLLMLSHDLLGHSLCMMGKFAQGMKALDQSLNYSEKIGYNSNSEVIRLAKLQYNIDAGVDLNTQEKVLNTWIESLKAQDYFSKTNALLLKAKVLQLKGDFKGAEGSLMSISQNVYEHNHNRQILEYNLMMAQLSTTLNKPDRALALIRTSLKLAVNIKDFYSILRFRELEFAIESMALGKQFDGVKNNLELKNMALKVGRNLRVKYPLGIIPEEKIDNFLDKPEDEIVESLDEKGMLGLLLLGGRYSENNFIEFRNLAKRILLNFQGKIYFLEEFSSGQIEFLKLVLSRRIWTKKALFESFWQVEYDSYIHDNKLYVYLGRLRAKLKGAKDFIKLEKGLIKTQELKIFDEDLRNRFYEELSINSSIINLKTNGKLNPYMDLKLNIRQNKFLTEFSSGEVFKPANYSKYFKISRNTCSRDLYTLVQSGHIKRIGSGAGTYYLVI